MSDEVVEISDDDSDELYVNVESAIQRLVRRPDLPSWLFTVTATNGQSFIVHIERPNSPPALVSEAILRFADGTEVFYELKRQLNA